MARQSFDPGLIELGVSYEYELGNHARRGHDVTANPKEEITKFSTVNLEASYALGPRLRIQGQIPIRKIVAPKTDLASGDRYLREFSGIGDVLVSGTWLPYSSENSDMSVVALTAGLRLATGDADPDHDWGYGNSRDPVLQPGYGTVDPILGVTAARQFGKVSATFGAVTRLSGGVNVHGYRFADEYQGVAGVGLPIAEWMDLGVSAAVLTAAHDFDTGQMVQNTGGLWGYLIPQLTLKATGVRVEPSVQVPVYAFVNGGQLVSDAIYSVGLRFDVGHNPAIQNLAPREIGLSAKTWPSNMVASTACSDCGLSNVISKEDLTLVELMSEECSTCKAFEPTLIRFATTHPELAVKQVNYFSLTKEQLWALGVEETPTLLLYDPDGTLKCRVTGTDLKLIEEQLQ